MFVCSCTTVINSIWFLNTSLGMISFFSSRVSVRKKLFFVSFIGLTWCLLFVLSVFFFFVLHSRQYTQSVCVCVDIYFVVILSKKNEPKKNFRKVHFQSLARSIPSFSRIFLELFLPFQLSFTGDQFYFIAKNLLTIWLMNERRERERNCSSKNFCCINNQQANKRMHTQRERERIAVMAPLRGFYFDWANEGGWWWW